MQRWGFRYIEALVIALIGTIVGMFGVQMFLSHPEYGPALHSFFIPSLSIVTNPDMLYIAIGILGATVMPHNLYLHSSIVQSRKYERTPKGKREAITMANIDSALALTVALFVNAAILIVAAAVFHRSGHFEVAAIQDAYKLLSPLLGAAGASTLFAIALLASGQNSSITGTLAGQVVMEGFIHLRLSPWLRRLITRSLAIIPTIIVVAVTGEQGTEKLLILSQVILSLQLSFAVIPLVLFTGSRKKMGEFVNAPWLQSLAWLVAVLIAGLNGWLLILMCR
jgi:manganese transport protein